ncbi:MAG: hypothetical protein EZS28_004221 [Streblomastix strix]|uniref:Uncharacterized protein n=1 Tax=Streblomastix strix TaxID=222440 RepID=A0A5J4WZ40_9EUKA|nr:MAG: hypothetical protein EZS28_004221 [Streblomastix strix]
MKEKEKDVSYQSTRSKSKSDSSSSRHHSHRSSSDKEQIHSVRSTDSRRVQSDSDEQEQISDQDIIVEANVERGSQRDYFNGEREEDSLFGYSVLESNAHKEGID